MVALRWTAGGLVMIVCVLFGSSESLAQAPAARITVNGIEFVHVPAGPFTMGTPAEECVRAVEPRTPNEEERARQYCSAFESPRHQVTLAAFYIMRTEVTIAHYDRFAQATGARRPDDHRPAVDPGAVHKEESATGIPFSQARRGAEEPVTDVSWAEANQFCAWLGRGTPFATRLPTEAEWEKAARGTDGRTYPWGNTFDGRRLNFADARSSQPWRDASVNDGFADLAPVGSFPEGASPDGALDMAGNVSEWVSSLLWPYPYVATDGREAPGETHCTEANLRGCRAYRGGSYRHSAARTRSASRVNAAYLAPHVDTGFRCAAQPRSPG